MFYKFSACFVVRFENLPAARFYANLRHFPKNRIGSVLRKFKSGNLKLIADSIRTTVLIVRHIFKINSQEAVV